MKKRLFALIVMSALLGGGVCNGGTDPVSDFHQTVRCERSAASVETALQGLPQEYTRKVNFLIDREDLNEAERTEVHWIIINGLMSEETRANLIKWGWEHPAIEFGVGMEGMKRYTDHLWFVFGGKRKASKWCRLVSLLCCCAGRADVVPVK